RDFLPATGRRLRSCPAMLPPNRHRKTRLSVLHGGRSPHDCGDSASRCVYPGESRTRGVRGPRLRRERPRSLLSSSLASPLPSRQYQPTHFPFQRLGQLHDGAVLSSANLFPCEGSLAHHLMPSFLCSVAFVPPLECFDRCKAKPYRRPCFAATESDARQHT